jgi:hypothetical protein
MPAFRGGRRLRQSLVHELDHFLTGERPVLRSKIDWESNQDLLGCGLYSLGICTPDSLSVHLSSGIAPDGSSVLLAEAGREKWYGFSLFV